MFSAFLGGASKIAIGGDAGTPNLVLFVSGLSSVVFFPKLNMQI